MLCVFPLQRRIEQREERSSAAHPAPASSNWSKETFSFWLKKHLQQPDPGHRSKAIKESPHFATVGSHRAVSSSAVSETVLSRSRSVMMLAQELYVHVCLMRYHFKGRCYNSIRRRSTVGINMQSLYDSPSGLRHCIAVMLAT